MFEWAKNILVWKPFSYDDYLKTKALETAAKNGTATVVQPSTKVNVSVPWYVTGALVAVGGLLLYKYGAKILKIK